MGGEKFVYLSLSIFLLGSPPHGRGKAYIFSTFWGVERITPAWAGKRRPSTLGCAASGDHPRMGGEKGYGCLALCPCRGSPPHGRGKDHKQFRL